MDSRGLDRESREANRAGTGARRAEPHAAGRRCRRCARRAHGVLWQHQVHSRPDDSRHEAGRAAGRAGAGVEWTVRAIYADRMGWFDRNATNLFPLPDKDRASEPSRNLLRLRIALCLLTTEISRRIRALSPVHVKTYTARAQAVGAHAQRTRPSSLLRLRS